MEILKTKSDYEIVGSLIAELAKATNELRCSKQDQLKIEGRLNFALVLLNELKAKHTK